MTDSAATVAPLTGHTAWARNLEEPLRSFLRTETGGAAMLLAAAVVALIWANADPGSYTSVWGTELSIRIGGSGISQTLHQWVNDGLMTFFFLVVALEARREFDLGELRDRRRLLLPAAAADRRDGGADRDLPRVQRRRPGARTAGGPRCRPTPPSRWGCSRSSGGASRRACGRSS